MGGVVAGSRIRLAGAMNLMASRGLTFSAVVISLLACDGAGILGVLPKSRTPEGIGFETQDTLFTTGDTVTLTLTNSSDRWIGYNLCTSDLEVRNGSRWERVRKMPENSACTMQLDLLPPGGSDEYRQPVYDFIQRGTYRFRDEIEWMDSGAEFEVLSNGFRVR